MYKDGVKLQLPLGKRQALQELRWPSNVFVHPLAVVIQRMHKDCKMQCIDSFSLL